MDFSKHESDVDNHNTNQNEATSRANLMPDQFPDTTFLSRSTAPAQQNLEVNDLNLKVDPGYHGMVPAIIVTPASPGQFEIHNDRSDFRSFEQTSNESNSRNLELELLCTPDTDTTLNISRPDMGCGETNNGLDTINDEDIEVICRYSSTPVMSNTARNGPGLEDSDCSMMSLNNASPIAPADSCVGTPIKSIHHEFEADGENKVTSGDGHQVQGSLLVHPQYVCQHPGQPLLRHDGASSQELQPGFDDERNVNQCSLPTALIVTGACSNTPNVYSTYMPGGSGYNDYFPTRDSSWTDLSYSSDLSPVPPMSGNQGDPCCYSMMSSVPTETEYFVYPSIYVSSAGLISVLLRNDMSVEMTVDRTIRVVSHNHMMAVATDSRGTAACLYHPAVKVFQIGTTTDIATQNFRARMGGGDAIVFSNGINFFKLEDSELQPTAPIKFTDILRDQSVNLLFSSEGYGESLVASCMQVAAQAEYANLPKGGVIVRINGVKVTQTGGGDVTVVTGAKFIRLSPHFGTTRLGNRFVDIEVEKDWTVKLTRGSHSFVYSKKRAMVCNGKMEAGFDENNGLKVTNLQPRHPLLAEPSVVRRPVRKPVRVASSSGTPKRRPGPQGMGRGGGML
ncbi:uncharacterized protein LOC131957019 [Physella acuta]|uniref:uncharacterized protein LOC131957019 n=1 Tax=Physella acuta TaxID=109671 RepID=UPI0027DCE1C3|nr:uncharacterized protein LOC131957019 [Physella acuta]